MTPASSDDQPTDDQHGDDAGLTLVELLVYMFVGALFLGILGAVFVGALRADSVTRERDLATGQLQAISTSLSTTVRSASAVRVETSGGTTVVRAALPGDRCSAWAFTTPAGAATGIREVRVRTYTAFATGSAPAPGASWGVLAPRVRQVVTATGTAWPFAALASADAPLTWNIAVPRLDAAASSAPAASISGSAVPLGKTAGGSGKKCW